MWWFDWRRYSTRHSLNIHSLVNMFGALGKLWHIEWFSIRNCSRKCCQFAQLLIFVLYAFVQLSKVDDAKSLSNIVVRFAHCMYGVFFSNTIQCATPFTTTPHRWIMNGRVETSAKSFTKAALTGKRTLWPKWQTCQIMFIHIIICKMEGAFYMDSIHYLLDGCTGRMGIIFHQ